MGTIGALVALETKPAQPLSPAQRDQLRALGNDLAMHIVGSGTKFISPESCAGLPEVESERAIHLELAQKSGKPAEIVEKMVQGKMTKFYEELVLTEQKSVVHEGTPKVEKVLAQTAKALGVERVEVSGMVRFKCGDSATPAPATQN
eukprot:c14585_g1_i4.p1 GENE.c14585_g1_i4~~c14585_g1_i4.p1  ORF type:complete len:147 (+),score=42.12 c14585_g1_i4:142-582(+)